MLNAWTTVSVTSDLTGIPRVIAAERLWRAQCCSSPACRQRLGKVVGDKSTA